VWRRADVLAAICAARRTIAVAGTHGKTTTSSMLALILQKAGLQPSYIIGGDLVGVGPGAKWEPEGEWMVVEADESDGTFLRLGAEAVIVTSVEPDHLDFYGDEAALREAFERFVTEAPGPRVLCVDDAGSAALAAVHAGESRRVVTYGTAPAAGVHIRDLVLGRSTSEFSVTAWGTGAGPMHLAAPGLHNVRNAAAAATMAHLLGVPWDECADGIGEYRGVRRRFEFRGERDGVTYVDDYGHLPGEILATLAGAAGGGWQRMVAVFQPHRYSRTAALWQSFADAFEGADVLLVTDVYPAGEAPREGVSGKLIADAVVAKHPDADVRYVPTLDDAEVELRALLRPGDLCLTLGAGDLTTLADRFVGNDDEIPHG
jgi:UDP-N-acetylmuramate--alanine ligase